MQRDPSAEVYLSLSFEVASLQTAHHVGE